VLENDLIALTVEFGVCKMKNASRPYSVVCWARTYSSENEEGMAKEKLDAKLIAQIMTQR